MAQKSTTNQRFYLQEIEAYKTSTDSWYNKATKIVDFYKNKTGTVRYNIEWSTVETFKPLIYSATPKVVVERRIKSQDPVSRVASEGLQRATQYQMSCQPFDTTMRSVRDDRLLPGRGSAWVVYDPTFTSDSQGEEQLSHELAVVKYIYWQNFGYNICKSWEDVRIVWYKDYFSKAQIEKTFGKEIATDLNYTEIKNEHESVLTTSKTHLKFAEVYEIWDKETGKQIFLVKDEQSKIIGEKKAPLSLHGFFPCPKPLFATLTSDINIPQPDFLIAEQLAIDIDLVSQRAALAAEAIKSVGLTSKEAYNLGLKQMYDSKTNQIIPIDNFMALRQQGGQGNLIEWMPIKEAAEVLASLMQTKAQYEQDYYKIRGVSDILRGATNPYESGKSQQLKSEFAGQRLSEYQKAMQEFCADVVQIMAEITAEKFSDENIAALADVANMSPEDQQIFPYALASLRDDLVRGYKITIETDSTIAADDAAEKQAMNEYLSSFGQFASQAVPLLQMLPQLQPAVVEMLKMTSRKYRAGRTLEGILESNLNKMLAAQREAEMNPQPPPPSPEQIKAQVEQFKIETKAQLEQQKQSSKEQIAMMNAQLNSDIAQLKAQSEREKLQLQGQIESQKLELQQYEQMLKEAELQLKTQSQRATEQIEAAKLSQNGEIASNDVLMQILTAINDKEAKESEEGGTEGGGGSKSRGGGTSQIIVAQPGTEIPMLSSNLEPVFEEILIELKKLSVPQTKVAKFETNAAGERTAVITNIGEQS
jgi:hypothetical protein